jgi:hypothetical protein
VPFDDVVDYVVDQIIGSGDTITTITTNTASLITARPE